MPSTAETLHGDGTDWTAAVRAIGSRTDNTGTDVDDLGPDEDRLINHILTEGFLTADAFLVQDGATGMEVDVGSGTAQTDIYVVEGDTDGQHPYLVRMEDASVTIALDAGDADPRIDQIWLVVRENEFDASGLGIGQLVYRKGDAATDPDPPGPDASWEAAVLLASINVSASASEVAAGDITDERDGAGFASALNVHSEVDGSTEVASVTLGTSYSTVASVTLDIPSSWSSWKCVAQATFLADAPGGRTADVKLTIDGTDQQIQGDMGVSTDRYSNAIIGRRTGMTTTGSRTVELQALGSATDVEFLDIAMYARAVRTS